MAFSLFNLYFWVRGNDMAPDDKINTVTALFTLDEPSEGIQPNIISMIGDILCEINKELGLTVLFVEQHIGLIQKVANRCYAMDKGSIVRELDSNELHKNNLIQKYLSV